MAICPPDLLATIITLFACVETSKTELFLSIVAVPTGLLYHEFNMNDGTELYVDEITNG